MPVERCGVLRLPVVGRICRDIARSPLSLRIGVIGRRRARSNRMTNPMKDYQANLERLRKDAVECALIWDRATNHTKWKCSMGWLSI
jgi:hypothetical protein